jgi:hypothetical protein
LYSIGGGGGKNMLFTVWPMRGTVDKICQQWEWHVNEKGEYAEMMALQRVMEGV